MANSPLHRLLPLFSVLLLIGSACASSGTFRDGTFKRSGVEYRLTPPGDGWAQISFSGNDLAWANEGGDLIAINSECEGHGDASLEVLTNHLLLGFDDRQVRERDPFRLDGRAALRTRLLASLDGVPVELELTVLKKDGCVYDLTYLGAPGRFDGNLALYRSLVESFEAGARR